MPLVNEAGEKLHKVMVAVPCGDHVTAGFALDLALLMGYTTFVRPDLEVRLSFLRGTYLPRARATLVKDALAHTCTHILWVDSDMRFPKDALLRLLAHDQPIVGANYATRVQPILPTAVGEDRHEVFQGEGLTEVKYAGMGLMLTAVEVFQTIGRPHFALGYNRTMDEYSGEDVYFCEKARQNGFPVLIDHALSESVMHEGMFAYHMAHARMTRDAVADLAHQTAPQPAIAE